MREKNDDIQVLPEAVLRAVKWRVGGGGDGGCRLKLGPIVAHVEGDSIARRQRNHIRLRCKSMKTCAWCCTDVCLVCGCDRS